MELKRGDDMAQLYPLIHLVFPTTPPYRLKGHLKHDGNVWSFANFSGRVGDSDSLSGAKLYFELRKDGRSIDPLPWLKKR